MKAVLIGDDAAGQLRPVVRDVPAASPGPREVLVRARGGDEPRGPGIEDRALPRHLLSLKRLSLIGVTFRTRSADDAAQLIARMQDDLQPLIARGRIRIPPDKVFLLAEVAQAHDWMGARQQFGKMVLQT